MNSLLINVGKKSKKASFIKLDTKKKNKVLKDYLLLNLKLYFDKFEVNKVLNKASACAKYAQRFLNLKRGSLFVFGNQAQASGEGVG